MRVSLSALRHACLLLAVCFGILVWGSVQVRAGTVTLVGDRNIFVNSQSGLSLGGNRQFFRNVIGTAENVLISNRPGDVGVGNVLNANYRFIFDIPSVQSSTPLTSELLSDVEFLWLNLGFDLMVNLSPSEESAILDYLSRGKDLGIFFEAGSINGGTSSANALLERLGLNMRLGPRFGGGFQTADTIVETELTAGVSNFIFALPHSIEGGTAAIQDDGFTIVAYEEFTAPTPIPIPASLPLLLAGFSAFSVLAFRRHRIV